ncbi:MAG: DUF5034 domain-containing protein [Bacteroidota bacterium]
MIKKIVFLFTLALMAEFLIACCDCGNTVYTHFTYKQFEVANLDNSGPALFVSNADSLLKTAYGIRLLSQTEVVASAAKKNFSLFLSPALATSCECEPPFTNIPRDTVTSFSIITLSNFDNAHPAGSDITTCFKYFRNRHASYSYYEIAFMKKLFNHFLNYTDDDGTPEDYYDLLLMVPPAQRGRYSFNVKISLSNGKAFNLFTPEILLK